MQAEIGGAFYFGTTFQTTGLKGEQHFEIQTPFIAIGKGQYVVSVALAHINNPIAAAARWGVEVKDVQIAGPDGANKKLVVTCNLAVDGPRADLVEIVISGVVGGAPRAK